jgi:DNA replicative helicase MCM subunit Mcm2 (Cdc46/Mcm family)
LVFEIEPHIQRARAHIDSGDTDRVFYACLELRYALERIAYQKLQLRLDKIRIEEIGAWQPRRAMDRLMELVDEHLTKDSTLSVAPESEPGTPATDGFVTVGQTKGVSPRKIGKYWQKLGSFLHIQMPKKKGQISSNPDVAALRTHLEEVIEYVEEVTSTGFDAYFSQNVTFTCGKCDRRIVRNSELLKEQDVIHCQNPECTASYITHIKGGEFTFKPYELPFECKSCHETTWIEANPFLQMKTNEQKY